MRRRVDWALYLVTDRVMCARLGIERVVGEAVAGGVTVVQLRDDVTPAAELIDIGRRLMGLLPADVPLIVNNRLDVARELGAGGAHVGQTDASPAQARAAVGDDGLVGLSITDPAQMEGTSPAVDYLGVGPVYDATATKPDAAAPIGIEGLRRCVLRCRLPVVAIGGITPDNAAAVMATGVAGMAIVSAICAAPDPKVAAENLARYVRQRTALSLL